MQKLAIINSKVNQAIITLGGKGTRLVEITKDIPKPLWKINGIHTLERTIKVLSKQGIKKFIWITGYKHELFEKEAIEISKNYDISIAIHKEEQAKGEAGSLLDMLDILEDDFLFVNGDIIFNIDIARLYEFHNRNNSEITFVTHFTNHPDDSDCIIESPSLSIYKYKLKNEYSNLKGFYLGNAGVALISKNVVIIASDIYKEKYNELSLFKDFIVFAHSNKLKVYSYNTSEYLKDMGTPNRLLSVSKEIKKGDVEKGSYKNTQTALFLDRDNTIIKCNQGDYITNRKQISLFKNRIKNISLIAKKFNIVILISNQPQIAMGKVSWEEVIQINGEIISKCQSYDLKIACFYICPHHPHSGYPEEINSLKTSCFCRKPLPGLFLEASINRNIDLDNSLMIGDSWRDRKAAEHLKMKFIGATELD